MLSAAFPYSRIGLFELLISSTGQTDTRTHTRKTIQCTAHCNQNTQLRNWHCLRNATIRCQSGYLWCGENRVWPIRALAPRRRGASIRFGELANAKFNDILMYSLKRHHHFWVDCYFFPVCVFWSVSNDNCRRLLSQRSEQFKSVARTQRCEGCLGNIQCIITHIGNV